MRKYIFIGALALSTVVANAGMTTSSSLPSGPKSDPMFLTVCERGNYPAGLIKALGWSGLGAIEGLRFSESPEMTQDMIAEWNKMVLSGVNGAGPANVIIMPDANAYLRFSVAADNTTFRDENKGEWLFLYRDGCFVDRWFIPLAPDNPPKPMTDELVEATLEGNSGYINPESDFRALTHGS